jgi:hypothetical protein
LRGEDAAEGSGLIAAPSLLGQNEELIRVFNAMPAGTFAVAVFHAQRNGAQMESGLFGKLERRHGAFRTAFSVAASVTLLKHLEKFRAPAIAS